MQYIRVVKISAFIIDRDFFDLVVDEIQGKKFLGFAVWYPVYRASCLQ